MSAATASAADPPSQQFPQARIDYAIHMRKLFSPPAMLHADGSINQEFFRPKKVLTLTDRKWGDNEREQLYKGLEKYGVGRWRDIGGDMLHGWDDHNIRVKTAKLLGCQNLSWYHGSKFTKSEAEAEFEQNKQLGAQTGCWKNGMLVDDDKGTLRTHFQACQVAAATVVDAGAVDEAATPGDDASSDMPGVEDMQSMPDQTDAMVS